MQFNSINEVPKSLDRAVIINFNTKLVTTLALLSAVKHTGMPILLIDCESKDGSAQHFQSLMDQYQFDFLSAPLKIHGVTLDWLFTNLQTERILLVDSDLFIRGPEIITFFKTYIDEPSVFGCGFINGPEWLSDPIYRIYGLENALYQERPWMPLTYLKVAPVKEAIESGKSFVQFNLKNKYFLNGTLDKFASRSQLVKKIALKVGCDKYHRTYGSCTPSVICYDTGAQIYEYLRYEKSMFFAGLPESVHPRFVTHFFGVTRNVLNPNDIHGGGGPEKIKAEVQDQLKHVFDYEME